MQHYKSIVAGSNLPQSLKDTLSSRDPYTLDELDEAYAELIYMLQHEAFYITLDRIEKGEAWTAAQTEPALIAKGRARLNELAIELERHRPKEDAI